MTSPQTTEDRTQFLGGSEVDGVIHSYTSPWRSHEHIPDPPVPGAIDWLNRIADDFNVVIFTTRGSTYEGRIAVGGWLAKHGFTRHREVTHKKVPALSARPLRSAITFAAIEFEVAWGAPAAIIVES